MSLGALTQDYDFDLPPSLIARQPNAVRDQSRLLIVDRSAGTIEHGVFADLAGLIPAGDTLVLNTTRVIRARLLGSRDSGGSAEVLLLRPAGEVGVYEAMVRPGGKLKPGRVVHVAPDLDVEILAVTERRTRLVRLVGPLPPDEAIERHGHVPLPPYMERADAPADVERYQTVYADARGSVAAPTAGLHFSIDLLNALRERGVRRADVVLHVGAGTFKPVEVDDPADHVMHQEWFRITADVSATLNTSRVEGHATWAVGTTSVRTLESAIGSDDMFAAQQGETRIFIRPPYRFRAVDKLITNFHLPRSTLIMLVSAFAGYELTMEAYRVAIAQRYRFYSYGDAMLVL